VPLDLGDNGPRMTSEFTVEFTGLWVITSISAGPAPDPSGWMESLFAT
jgi:hypothetical protein